MILLLFTCRYSALAKALDANKMNYAVIDITEQNYNILKKKCATALVYKDKFHEEGNINWFNMLMFQTESATKILEEFRTKMSRYIYVIKK